MYRVSTFVAVALLTSLMAIQPWNQSIFAQVAKTQTEENSVDKKLNEIMTKLDEVLQATGKAKQPLQADPSKRIDISKTVKTWIEEAKDDLQQELEHLANEYGRWKRETKIYLKPEDEYEFQKKRLYEIESRHTKTTIEIEETIQKVELLKSRLERIEVEKKEHRKRMSASSEYRARQRQFEGEIQRKQLLHDEIVKKLADIDLLELYGNQ